MKKIIALAVIITVMVGCKNDKNKSQAQDREAQVEEVISPEKTPEWVSLFDGETLNGWHGYLENKAPTNWSAQDGALMFTPPEERTSQKSLDIVTDKQYTSFVLSLEWKISEGGNSGIFWGVKEDEKFRAPYATGQEIQVLDNERHPDAKVGGKTHQAGALYDMIEPSQDVANPAGEWNLCVIQIDHDKNEGKVWLNEVEIVSFPLSGADWDAMVANSKFKGWDGFGTFKTGNISLQDHNDIVWYRDIKIKEL